MEVPKPTLYEKKLAFRLAAKNIPHKSQPVIWYTRANYYTPDFIIGQKLIVEVDFKTNQPSKKIKSTQDKKRNRIIATR